MHWLITAVGAAIVAVALRDVFLTLWVPSGPGPVQWRMSWLWWRLAHRRPRLLAPVVGGWTVAATIVIWGLLLTIGWALVYLPHMDDSFLFASGLEPGNRSDLVDSLYFSMVTITTVGFGDIVATDAWLRLLVPLEGLMGFALLSASVTWMLQIYPALGRRRTLAGQLKTLRDQRVAERLSAIDSTMPADLILDLSTAISGIQMDLTIYSQTYFFWDSEQRSLAAAIGYLFELVDAAEGHAREDSRVAADVLRSSLDDFAWVLGEHFVPASSNTADMLDAFVQDHRLPT